MNVGSQYDQSSSKITFSLNISGGNICYAAQCFFFAFATIAMYTLYSEANVVSSEGVDLNFYDLLWCVVLLLLLNETFFIPERFRVICRTIAAFLVWNNFETAACAAKKFYHDVQVDEQVKWTGDQIRVTRFGMFGVLFSVVGAFIASYLLPNGKQSSSFTAVRFHKCLIQSIFYCITVALLLVATFIQWSREDTCASIVSPISGATTKNYNATLLFVAFWIIFGVCTNDANTLDIALAILSSEIIAARPTSFADSDTKPIVVYSLLFTAAILFLVGSMLHSGLCLSGFTTNGFANRLTTKAFGLHIISLVLGISGSACVFSRTKEKDQLWIAFWAGWACPIFGIIAHLFEAEAIIVPQLFYVPQIFVHYGYQFILTSSSDHYLKGYIRAGSLLLMAVPIFSTLLFFTRNIQIQSFDEYLRADGAAALKASLLLFLASSLLWKTSSGLFWSVAFIALLAFASTYNQRTCLPKTVVLLCVSSVTIPALWLLSSDPELTKLQYVIVFLGLWMFITSFVSSSAEVAQNIESIHDSPVDNSSSSSASPSGTNSGTTSPRQQQVGGSGYTALGGGSDDNNNDSNSSPTAASAKAAAAG